MPTQPVIATHKIIAFIVFLCGAIITSLFVYHINHAPRTSGINDDNRLIFPISHDVNPFELIASDGNHFTQNNFRNHWTLVFFGFTHCASICPTTLDMIAKSYPRLMERIPNLQVVLVSLDPERDTPDQLGLYVKSFNKAFIGISGKIQEVRKFQSQFGVYSARDNAAGNYQLQHTASIMLVSPQGKWAGMFRFGMNPVQFTQAITDSVQTLGA